jgi:hypothetical protein
VTMIITWSSHKTNIDSFSCEKFTTDTTKVSPSAVHNAGPWGKDQNCKTA